MKKIARVLLPCFLFLVLPAVDRPAAPAEKPGADAAQGVHPSGTKGGPMVLVPAGEFVMGMKAEAAYDQCQQYSDHCRLDNFSDAEPVHKVYLDAFFMDRFEVTQEEYQACVQAGPCRSSKQFEGFDRPRQPVVGVGWEDAKSYCGWAGKRLPTEAEWEKAARGPEGREYPWGDASASCEYAVMSEEGQGCGRKKTWEVGSKPAGASPYGALDMAGNVWEWVADSYDKNYYRVSPAKNPTGPKRGEAKVVRGGSWRSEAWDLHPSFRMWTLPGLRFYNTGFRCALSSKQE